ncbi:hypothetical protein STEG23_014940 [Scotinomys teguina]
MGPEASFFDALDRHRASLLAMVKRGTRESPARATHVASRYCSSAGHRKAWKGPWRYGGRCGENIGSMPEPRNQPPITLPAFNS